MPLIDELVKLYFWTSNREILSLLFQEDKPHKLGGGGRIHAKGNSWSWTDGQSKGIGGCTHVQYIEDLLYHKIQQENWSSCLILSSGRCGVWDAGLTSWSHTALSSTAVWKVLVANSRLFNHIYCTFGRISDFNLTFLGVFVTSSHWSFFPLSLTFFFQSNFLNFYSLDPTFFGWHLYSVLLL